MKPRKLIVGLGNPSSTYKNTRHNIGFRVLDKLAHDLTLQFEFQKELESEVAKNTQLILAKPQTHMNTSGKAVQKLLAAYLPRWQANGFGLYSLLIVHDDIDLPFGIIRVSKKSGSAGHKGVESIISKIGKRFFRLRLGIENRKHYRIPDTETYVLQDFNAVEKKELKASIIPKSVEGIKKFIETD